MRISLNWLQELVDISLSPDALADVLTMAGFEVEAIEDRRTWADGVVVGRVVECQPHPNADKLRVCQVDLGASALSNIVCGAPNVKAGMLVPVATLGTYLPTIDLKIKPAKLRGVASEGMICSLAELGLAKESEGIHSFEQPDLPLGSDVRPLLGLDDVILDLTSTANRADALSMVGVAREVSILTGVPLKLPSAPDLTLPPDSKQLTLKILEPQGCPTYIGTLIQGVTITPSPRWLEQRLQACGIRPINNVVDITNYILLEWGQPLHAFDYDRLLTMGGSSKSLQIGVRFAEAQETLRTLDGQGRVLTEHALLITANNTPVALAGVMGGEETEVCGDTQTLMLEAALFDAATIRRSARSQGLRTEASARYERGVNQAELEYACRRALGLIEQLAGGQRVAQVVADTRSEPTTRSVELRLERVHQVLGPIEQNGEAVDLMATEVERILKALGCELTDLSPGQVWMVTVPAYRARDLEREIDLIEEIARIYGYNDFCDTLPEKTEAGYLPFEQELTRKIREAMRAIGLTEVTHYSLV
ncbi:MAG TPA: phenylalanine--tRNA ligase subunit beta, partial [Coleofasciculaceae cyanobacterium]